MLTRLLIAIVFSAEPTSAGTVVGWRTDGRGMYDSTSPPVRWSPTENVVWATEMPACSNAQPVIADGKIFTCADPNLLICVRAGDGKILWQRTNSYKDVVGPDDWPKVQAQLAQAETIDQERASIESNLRRLKRNRKNAAQDEGIKLDERIDALAARAKELEELHKALPLAQKYAPLQAKENYSGFTTATPTTDGRHVWAVFGNAVVACYDTGGNRKWITKLDEYPQSMWGHSASPLLVGDQFFVNIDGMVAFDALTGKQNWRRGYNQCWGSSVHVRIGQTDLVAVANGKFLRADDGALAGRGMRLMNSSPLLLGNRMYFIQNPGEAIELPAEFGTKLEFKKLWETAPNGQTHYASPVMHNGLIYTVSSRGIMSVINAENGDVVTAKRLRAGPGSIFSSIALAGDYLYVTGESGRTVVLKAGTECEFVATNQLDRCLSTPVFQGDRMYLRTFKYLYCIGQ